MRWKRVAWAGCLAPVLGGCHTAFPAGALVADAPAARTEAAIERQIHQHAREAWRAVRAEYPRKAFSPEFRDGFLDGYSDYLDRGGDAGPPAVPPPRYTDNPKYFTPEGHVLIRDYFLGFKYGADVAAATGQRQFLTVPVLIPDMPDVPATPPVAVTIPAPPAILTEPPAVAPPAVVPNPVPAPMPLSVPRPILKAAPPPDSGIPGYHLPAWNSDTPVPGAKTKTAGTNPPPASTPPKPPVPSIPTPPPAVPPPDTGMSKFGPLPAPLRVPKYTAPELPDKVPGGTSLVPALPGLPTAAEVGTKLPEPPAEVPSLPAGVPTPPVLDIDDLPVIPPNHTVPPPLPANHPDPAGN